MLIFAIFMFIFGIAILFMGIYLYTGHKNEFLLWKVPNSKRMTKQELKNIGKSTMISGLLPIILGIIALFLYF